VNRWLVLLCCCLALVVAVATGCGGDDDESEPEGGGGGGAAQEKPETSGGGGAAPKTARVVLKDLSFQPQEVTVARGGTVTWVDEDDPPHDVTKTGGPGPKFSSGTGDLKKGDTYEQKFSTAGTVNYVCTVHQGMSGTVTVK
jgi:plastocyanin